MFHTLLRRIAFPLFKLFYRPKVKGLENIPTDGNYVIIANHIGKIDVFAIASLYKQKIYFMAKKEWFKSKLSNKLFRWMGAIPIDRDHADITSIKTCFKLIRDGEILVIFPEGTRNKKDDGTLLPLKGGAGLIAFKSKVKVLPIAMNRRYHPFKKNHIAIGKPFDFSEFANEKASPALSETIKNKMELKLGEVMAEVKEFSKGEK